MNCTLALNSFQVRMPRKYHVLNTSKVKYIVSFIFKDRAESFTEIQCFSAIYKVPNEWLHNRCFWLHLFLSGLFINIVARWPGSTHDSHVFRSSNICHHIEENYHSLDDGILLGDSGYACRHSWWPPIATPVPLLKLLTMRHTVKQGWLLSKLLAAGNVAFMCCIQKFVWHLKKYASLLVHVQFCTTSQPY